MENRNQVSPDDELHDDEDRLDEQPEDEESNTATNGPVSLDALEAEELEVVETNESATILVDEASEIKAMRRDEMALDMGKTGRRRDEFVCNSCFLLIKNVQLADPVKMLCVDCA